MNEFYLNTRQVSDMLGICYAKTLDFIKYSGVKYIKIGRTYYISNAVLHRFLAENTNINSQLNIDDSYLK